MKTTEKYQKCPVCDGRKEINAIPEYPMYGQIICPVCQGYGIINLLDGKPPVKLATK